MTQSHTVQSSESRLSRRGGRQLLGSDTADCIAAEHQTRALRSPQFFSQHKNVAEKSIRQNCLFQSCSAHETCLLQSSHQQAKMRVVQVLCLSELFVHNESRHVRPRATHRGHANAHKARRRTKLSISGQRCASTTASLPVHCYLLLRLDSHASF